MCQRLIVHLLFFLVFAVPVRADSPPVDLGQEYDRYSRSSGGEEARPGGQGGWLKAAALYLPNRVLDLIDVFRVDIGAGPSFGAVVRITKWGQAGYRDMEPLSLRVGLRGRRLPIFIERSAEFGVGPTFFTSPQRQIAPLEVGAGADLLIAGAYAGISIDELCDFVLGLVGFDISDDDLR